MPRRIDPSGVTGGLHAVEALLRDDPRRIRRLVLQHGAANPKLYALQKAAEAHGIRTQQLSKNQLDEWYEGPHQGILAFCESRTLEDWDAIRDSMLERKRAGEAPLLIVPASMEDPRNLGACVRTAAGLGADALLLPGKGSTGMTPAAAKAAAGAENAVIICRSRDIAKDLKELAAEGFAILGLDANGVREAHAADLTGPLVIVAGGEDRGIPPHIARCLTGTLRLPMAEGCHSYNASVALALLLYETARQRKFAGLGPQPKSA